MVNPDQAARRALPSVDRLLTSAPVAALISQFGRMLTVDVIRDLLQAQRDKLAQGSAAEFDEAKFLDACRKEGTLRNQPSLRPVFNLTGTVLHTNLGRALMPQSVADAVMIAMTRPVNLEFDLGGGARGERDAHVEKWITRLAGGDGAVVVNNNAAAVYLVLNTLGAKKEVLVSRGELIEIGGAFRIPDIMKRAGVKLVEVGATNRTRIDDYRDAITERTRLKSTAGGSFIAVLWAIMALAGGLVVSASQSMALPTTKSGKMILRRLAAPLPISRSLTTPA